MKRGKGGKDRVVGIGLLIRWFPNSRDKFRFSRRDSCGGFLPGVLTKALVNVVFAGVSWFLTGNVSICPEKALRDVLGHIWTEKW